MSDEIVFYSSPMSRGRIVHWMLEEVGAPYRFEVLSLETKDHKKPSYLAVNPMGKVPAIVHRGTVITESAAILLTVADHFPNARLLPPPAGPARARAYRWLAFMAAEIYPMVEVSDYPERFAPQGDAAEALREKAKERIRERLLIVERFVDGPWFLPSGFSILDIYASMFTRWRGSVGKDWLAAGHIPKLDAIRENVSRRAAIAPVWARHFGG